MAQVRSYVTLKGTKQGLQLLLDDESPFRTMLEQMEKQLNDQKDKLISAKDERLQVIVDAGRRYLSDGDRRELKELLETSFPLDVTDIRSEVVSRKEAEALVRKKQMIRMARVIRSGQVLELEGDVILIGDINPGAVLKTTGSIYVLGSLKGVAHAGTDGDVRAVISASFMDPSQLRIAHVVRQPPEDEEWRGMFECAYVNDEGSLELERAQKLGILRPELSGEE
ncbi:septum site-determining protein MinC [Bacillus daqingensis]|uniref:Probable septum site-determining protein MinC n=1 Tax=Bacillus daqingensis TaxID=872396 RepID=A0ABV9NVM9_9BACI